MIRYIAHEEHSFFLPTFFVLTLEQTLNHYHILATLFEDFKRNLAASVEKNLRAGALLGSKKSGMSLRGKPESGGEVVMARLWVGFPLHSDFYARFADAFARLPVDATVRLLLHFSPVNSAHFVRLDPSYNGRVMQSAKAHFSGLEFLSFDSWLDTLKSFSLQSPGGEEQLELLMRMGELVVAGLVSVALGKSSADLLSLDLREPLRAMAVDAFCYPFPSKRLPAAFVAALNRERHLAWCRVLSSVCVGNWSTLALFQEAGKPRDVEVWKSFLHALSWIKLDVDTPDSLVIGKRIVNELMGHIALSSLKKRQLLPVKAQMIETLGSILHTCDFSKMWDTIRDIYQNVSVNEWDKGETKRNTLQLMAIIVSCGPREFREREFNEFFSTRILKGVWEGKTYLLPCLLTLLRGKYVPFRLGPWAKPYSFVPFVGPNMIPMLKVVFRGIFERAKAIPGAVEGLDDLVNIVLQLAAHSLQLANSQMLPFLLHEKIPIHQLIGVRALGVILNDETGFWMAVQQTEGNEILARDDLIANVNTLVLKLMRACEEAVGLVSFGCDLRTLPVVACVSRQTPLLEVYTDSMHVVHARKRLLNVIQTTSERRRAEDAQRITVDMEKVSSAVHMWASCCDDDLGADDTGPVALIVTDDGGSSGSGGPGGVAGGSGLGGSANSVVLPSATSGLTSGSLGGNLIGGGSGGLGGGASGAGVSDRNSGAASVSGSGASGGSGSSVGGQPGGGEGGNNVVVDDRFIILQMYRECMSVLPYITTDALTIDVVHFVDALRHGDETLAATLSHSLQSLVRTRPAVCRPMFEAFLASLQALEWTNVYGITTLLSQALLMLDWWTYAHHTATTLSEGLALELGTAAELEATLAVYLAHFLPDVRLLAIDLMVGLSALCKLRGVAFVIDVLESEVMEKSRYAYLVQAGPRLDNNSPLPTIRQAASSPNMTLWGCVLSAIGQVVVDEADERNLSLLRHAVTHKAFSVCKVASPQYQHHSIRCFFSFSLSLLGVAAMVKTNRQRWQEQSMIVSELVNEFLSNANFFGLLLAAPTESPVHRAVVASAGAMHSSSIVPFTLALFAWYDAQGKTAMFGSAKPKPRHLLAACLRRLSQVAGVADVLHRSDTFRSLCFRFLRESPSVFDVPASKMPTMSQADYFLDDSGFLLNICSHLRGDPPVFTETGPLRKHLLPVALITEQNWPMDVRYNSLRVLIAWSGNEEVARERAEVDRDDMARRFAKDARARANGAKKLKRVHQVCRLAIGALMSVAPVYPDERLVTEATVNWLLTLEWENVRVLRWLLAFTMDRGSVFRMYVNLVYSKLESEQQMLLLDAIYDQFLPFAEDDSPHSGVMAHLHTYIQSHSLLVAKQSQALQVPICEEDRQFQHTVEERCGILWNLAFFGMENSVSSVRERSLNMLTRVAPWSHAPKSDPVHPYPATVLIPFFDECKKKLNHKILESAHNLAIAASAAMAKQHLAFTEEMWREAYYRSETTSAAQKRWALVFLLPWCDAIVLDDPSSPQKRTNLTLYTPFLFLEKLFQYFTVPVIDVLGTELMDLWTRLAFASPGNHSFILSYLVSKSTAFEDNIRVCKKIILHLYRVKPSETVAPFVFYLSFAGIKRTVGATYFNEMSDIDLGNASTPIKQQQGPAVAPTVLESDAKSIPRMAELVLIDLMCDQPEPVLPHLHIIMNYVLLEGYYYTIRTKQPMPSSIKELLYWVLVSIKNSLAASKSLSTEVMSLVASVDAMLTSSKLHSFRFEWAVHKYEKRLFRSSYNRSSSVRGAQKAASSSEGSSAALGGGSVASNSAAGGGPGPKKKGDAVVAAKGGRSDSNTSRRAIALHAEMQYNEEYGELARWACGTIDIRDFVVVMCKCFKIMRPKLIHKWGTEAFQWFVGSRDPRVSICAQEIYRAILEPTSAETLDASALRLLEVLRTLEVVKVVSHAKDSRDPELALAVSKAEEILITYEAQVPILDDLFLLQRVFWIAVAVLMCSHTIVKELHVHVYRILLTLEERLFFARIPAEGEPVLIVFQKIASEWNFVGLQRMLTTGLYVRKTGDLAARLLCKMPSVALNEVVDTSPCRHGLTVLAFLPWLLQKLSVARISSEDDDFLPLEIARALSESLRNCDAPLAVTVQLLDKYAAGELNSMDDEYLLDSISGELFAVYFRDNVQELCQSLATVMQVVVSTQPIYYRNVVRTIGKFISKPWSDKERAHFGRIIRMASQSLQQDSSRVLINVVISTVRPNLEAGAFFEQTKPIPHLTNSSSSTTASKMIVSLLKAKLPKSVNAFKQVLRKQTVRKPLAVAGVMSPQRGAGPAAAGALLASRGSGSKKDVLSGSTALPTAPARPLASVGTAQKPLSIGRGAGRGLSPPRKPLPPMARPQQAQAAQAAATVAAAPAAAALAAALDTSATDEEEEPSRDEESAADEEEEEADDDEDEDNAGASPDGSFLRMEIILQTPALRSYFDEWMPTAKRTPEVVLFDAVQQLQRETNVAEANKRANALVARHMGAGAPQEVALPVELVRQLKQEISVSSFVVPVALFGLVQNAVLASLDRAIMPLFRASDQYLGLLGHVVMTHQSGGELFDNPFLDRDEIEESTEPNDNDGQNPYVGGDIDELADLAQNLNLEDDNMLLGFE